MLRKINLSRAMRAVQELFPDEYDFYPRSWILPDEYQQFSTQVQLCNTKTVSFSSLEFGLFKTNHCSSVFLCDIYIYQSKHGFYVLSEQNWAVMEGQKSCIHCESEASFRPDINIHSEWSHHRGSVLSSGLNLMCPWDPITQTTFAVLMKMSPGPQMKQRLLSWRPLTCYWFTLNQIYV